MNLLEQNRICKTRVPNRKSCVFVRSPAGAGIMYFLYDMSRDLLATVTVKLEQYGRGNMGN